VKEGLMTEEGNRFMDGRHGGMKVKQIYEIRVDPGIPENPVYLEPMVHEREFTEEEYREIVNSAAIEDVKRLLD